MSDAWPLIVVAIALVLIGALVSLLALPPPIRRLCRRSPAARVATICILGSVSFLISFGSLMRLGAEAAYVFGTMVIVDTFDPDEAPTATWSPEAQEDKPPVVKELWRRLLAPPLMRWSCYAEEAWVCDLADDVLPPTSDRWSWRSYLRDVGIGCVSVLTSGLLVWLFTRKKRPLRITPLALFSLLLCSCNGQHGLIEPATPTPTVVIYADTFFSGCAYLDANGNREIDPDEPLLGGATFVVTLNGGAGFGAFATENHCASVTVPGGLGEEFWPVTVRMEPPEGTDYKLVSPSEVILPYPESHADFLFSNPQ